MKKYHIWALLGILAMGAFLRFFLITEIPPGLYPDEAMNGNNALEALATGKFKIFYPENNGREGLFINIQALSLALFGATPWALRIVSALIGTVTILGVYLVSKELLANNAAALFASFFLAVSYWHINFSRIGFRAIMVPFFACFGVYFLLKGLRQGSIPALTLAGIFTGLGLHTYIAFRLMGLVFAVPLAWYLIKWIGIKNDGQKTAAGKSDFPREVGLPRLNPCAPCAVALFAFVVLIVALPLAMYFIRNPHDLLNRAGDVSVFAAASPIKEFAKSTALTAAMFFWSGDCNWRHNFNCAPAFHPLVAVFSIIGILISLRRLVHMKSMRPDLIGFRPEHILLWMWLLAMALPAALTRESIPHALRAIGMVPPLIMLAGLGADRARIAIAEWAERKKAEQPQYERQIIRIRYELLIFFALALLVVPLATYRTYFLRWSHHPETHKAFDASSYHLGQFLAGLPQDTKKYVVVNTRGVLARGIPMPAQTVMFATDTFRDASRPEKNFSYLTREQAERIAVIPDARAVVAFLNGSDRALIRDIQKKHPELQLKAPGDFVVLQNY